MRLSSAPVSSWGRLRYNAPAIFGIGFEGAMAGFFGSNLSLLGATATEDIAWVFIELGAAVLGW